MLVMGVSIWPCYPSQALASLGPFVESNAGHARFLAIYATSAIAGSLASYLFCPSMSVGASGAIVESGQRLKFCVRLRDREHSMFAPP
jgi:hypothetical protein